MVGILQASLVVSVVPGTQLSENVGLVQFKKPPHNQDDVEVAVGHPPYATVRGMKTKPVVDQGVILLQQGDSDSNDGKKGPPPAPPYDPFAPPAPPCSLAEHDGGCVSVGFVQNHTHNEECSFHMPAVPIHVVEFRTEASYDKLTVNGVDYHGDAGPEGVIPQGPLVWSSDHSVVGDGFVICPAFGSECDMSSFSRSADGCFSVSNHGSNEQCTFLMPAVPIRVMVFDTEVGYDTLTVNGVEYNGTAGPEGVIPQGQLVWSSDYSNAGEGFKICPATTPICVNVLHDWNREGCDEYMNISTGGTCGDNDDADFTAADMCCMCSGGVTHYGFDSESEDCDDYDGKKGRWPAYPPQCPRNGCLDTPGNASDNSPRFGEHGCFSYLNDPDACGNQTYNDDDFTADDMCCACGGGLPSTSTTTTTAITKPTTPTTPPAPPCSVVEHDGGCVSVGFLQNHTHNEECSFHMPAVPIHVVEFRTEASYDKLTVNGVDYHGDAGPEGVIPQGPLVWSSDHSVAGDGFAICPAFGSECDMSSFSRSADGCFSVSNHGSKEHCRFWMPAVPIRVMEFDTEADFDKLTVNGVEYHGTAGPEGVIPQGQLVWSSDSSVNADGFKICPATTPICVNILHDWNREGCDEEMNISTGGTCGDNDDADFTAADMCCVCSGGVTHYGFDSESEDCDDYDGKKGSWPGYPPQCPRNGCLDTPGNASDSSPGSDNPGCFSYLNNPDACGNQTYNDDDFTADDMCCACGGGLPSTSTTTMSSPPGEWDLVIDGYKCTGQVFGTSSSKKGHKTKSAQSTEAHQYACEQLAIQKGHPFYQYHIGKGLCVTDEVCWNRIEAAGWAVYRDIELWPLKQVSQACTNKAKDNRNAATQMECQQAALDRVKPGTNESDPATFYTWNAFSKKCRVSKKCTNKPHTSNFATYNNV